MQIFHCEICFIINFLNHLLGDPPEWFDLSKYYEEVKGLHDSVKNVLQNEATEWMQETFIDSEDSVYQLTKGKYTTVCTHLFKLL